jgi:hypothetical protein
MYNTTWRSICLGNSLKLRCHFVTMKPELNRSVSEKMSKRVEMPLMKSNGKCQLKEVN